jgi:hypothetical protein
LIRIEIFVRHPLFFVDLKNGDSYNANGSTEPREESMRHNILAYLVLCALSTALVLACGCEDAVRYANSAPQDLKITPEKCYVAAEATIRLVGVASDADDDSLTFSWRATGGSFSPSSASNDTAYWTAPQTYGAVTVTMSVTDEIDTRSLKQVITVCELLPTQYLGSETIPSVDHLYITRGDVPIRISGNATLTIEPGVTIVMDKSAGAIECYGRINAIGTKSQRIRIRGNSCASEAGLWNGIYFLSDLAEGLFRNCDITGGMDGVSARDGARLDIKDCEIYNQNAFGVSVLYESSAIIRDSNIWDNGNGIYIETSAAELVSCSIRYSDGDGVVCGSARDDVQASIDSCVVANNYRNGFVIADRGAPAIHYCSIFANGEAGAGTYAVRLSANTSPVPIPAEHNYWGLGNDTEEEIAAVIYDAVDNPAAIFAYVSFIPWLTEAPATAGKPAVDAAGGPWAR